MTDVQLNDERLPKQFWEKVKLGECGCWLWKASKLKGYGLFEFAGMRRAHRVAYTFLVGPIPVGLQIDHLCRVRNCVNPRHLEAVTQQENIRRGDAGGYLKRRTQCKNGHTFTPENTYLAPDGHRNCRVCRRAYDKRYYYKLKEEKT